MTKEHLHKLLYETETWNDWRQQNLHIRPDLSRAVINSLAAKSTLDRVNGPFRIFQERTYQDIDFLYSDLHLAKFSTCNLNRPNFVGADLKGAEFRRCRLEEADFRGADLRKTQFLVSDIKGAHFEDAIFGNTYFGASQLTDIKGFEQSLHKSDSNVDQFTIINSYPLPDSLLKACNVNSYTTRMAEWFIQNNQPYDRCFISYSRKDETFVGYLHEALTRTGVPSWFAPKDMRNEKLHPDKIELERELFINVDVVDCFLLIISPNIIPSAYVTKEYQRAKNKIKIIPLLIEDIPAFNSSEWKTLIAKRVKTEKTLSRRNKSYPALSPDEYSDLMMNITSVEQKLNFRHWLDPSVFAQQLPQLLKFLQRKLPTS